MKLSVCAGEEGNSSLSSVCMRLLVAVGIVACFLFVLDRSVGRCFASITLFTTLFHHEGRFARITCRFGFGLCSLQHR